MTLAEFRLDQSVPEPPASGSGTLQPASLLKIYLNLLHQETGRARSLLNAALRDAGVPVRDALLEALEILEGAGFLHELGFGLGPGGRIACKIYCELGGWRRSLVRHLLVRVGLPQETDPLCPEIPGVLLESLAAKSRAGIALGVDAETGDVRELTTAAAFPPPMLTPAETRRRVEAWIAAHEWEGSAYTDLCDVLLPGWQSGGEPFGRLHSLFMRSVSFHATWTTIYLRPRVEGFPTIQ